MKKDKHLVVRVPEAYLMELKAAAAEDDLKMADVVRKLVRGWYEQRMAAKTPTPLKKSATSTRR